VPTWCQQDSERGAGAMSLFNEQLLREIITEEAGAPRPTVISPPCFAKAALRANPARRRHHHERLQPAAQQREAAGAQGARSLSLDGKKQHCQRARTKR
jgi:hypothetical protein